MAGQKAANKSVKTKDSLSAIGKFYLIAYNGISFAGWSYVTFLTFKQFLTQSENSLWDAVNPPLMIFQSLAALEIIHAIIGLVRSGLLTTIMQVLSRLFIVWVNLYVIPESRESPGLPLLLVAWGITEMVRYSFYALGIVNKIPYFLTWARYSLFYVLYPVGAGGEMLVSWYCLPYADKTSLNLTLPNPINFSLSHLRFIQVVLFSYIFLLPVMIMHMINQRKKVLGGAKSKTK